MGREPRVTAASVALAGIDVNISSSVFAVAVDDVFASDCVVLLS